MSIIDEFAEAANSLADAANELVKVAGKDNPEFTERRNSVAKLKSECLRLREELSDHRKKIHAQEAKH